MGVITPRDQAKLAALEDLARAVQSIYGLTEQFAAARSREDDIAQQIKRRCARFKRVLMTAGFDQLSQLAGALALAAGRSGSQRAKTRVLREGVASLRFQLDMEERSIRSEASSDEEGEPNEGSADGKP